MITPILSSYLMMSMQPLLKILVPLCRKYHQILSVFIHSVSIWDVLDGDWVLWHLYENNAIDKMLSTLPENIKNQLIKRYESISLDPSNIKFIDRMVADSRSVALKHTAGLSLPQQTQMTLFSLFFIIEDDINYIEGTKNALNKRIHVLYKSLGLSLDYDTTATNYYAIIDLV